MNIKKIFKNQKLYLDYFYENIDLKKTEKILNLLLNCKNNLIFTGIGKSGIIANKIAMTMLSTGTKALYLPATDALHGDIGIVSKDDIFIVLSKSGETNELLDLIPYVKKRNAKVISFVSNKNSSLEKVSDEFLLLPVLKELCPYNLAPTTSTTVQLMLGDVLTIALMQMKNFSLNDYAINHPKGAIGKQITLKVEDLMVKDNFLPLCNENNFIKDVLHVLSEKQCGCILIVDDKKSLKGIFTDGDLRRLIERDKNFLEKSLKNFMEKKPFYIEKNALAIEAMKKMESTKQITVLPVIEDNKVIGLIRMHDIVKAGLTSLTL